MTEPEARAAYNEVATGFEVDVREVCDELAEMLIAKNRAYGNSALDPLRIFARGVDTVSQIDVRLDDKLSRLARGAADTEIEDVEKDLLGYLVLRRIAAKHARLVRPRPAAPETGQPERRG